MGSNVPPQNKTYRIIRSMAVGLGTVLLCLTLGLVLDYGITQILSQYFLQSCSEDCYFILFNRIFVGIAILSVLSGMWRGLRTFKQLSNNNR